MAAVRKQKSRMKKEEETGKKKKIYIGLHNHRHKLFANEPSLITQQKR